MIGPRAAAVAGPSRQTGPGSPKTIPTVAQPTSWVTAPSAVLQRPASATAGGAPAGSAVDPRN
eukprot:10400804-Lingulodinium_polyedra.AAC.1